jgi:hypothetical protein
LFLSFWYLAFRCVLQLVLLRPRSTEFKELEIVVLRHQLACGVGKLDSRCEAVFVDGSTEAIAALNIGLWWAHGAPSPALRRIIRTVVAETAMPRP